MQYLVTTVLSNSSHVWVISFFLQSRRSLSHVLKLWHTSTVYVICIPDVLDGGAHCSRTSVDDIPIAVMFFGASGACPAIKMPASVAPLEVRSGGPSICVRTVKLTFVQASILVQVIRFWLALMIVPFEQEPL